MGASCAHVRSNAISLREVRNNDTTRSQAWHAAGNGSTLLRGIVRGQQAPASPDSMQGAVRWEASTGRLSTRRLTQITHM